jgi:hypothetical protein
LKELLHEETYARRRTVIIKVPRRSVVPCVRCAIKFLTG